MVQACRVSECCYCCNMESERQLRNILLVSDSQSWKVWKDSHPSSTNPCFPTSIPCTLPQFPAPIYASSNIVPATPTQFLISSPVAPTNTLPQYSQAAMDFLSQALEKTMVLGESREPPPLVKHLPAPTPSVTPTPILSTIPNPMDTQLASNCSPCPILLPQTVLYQNYQTFELITTFPPPVLMPLQQLHWPLSTFQWWCWSQKRWQWLVRWSLRLPNPEQALG